MIAYLPRKSWKILRSVLSTFAMTSTRQEYEELPKPLSPSMIVLARQESNDDATATRLPEIASCGPEHEELAAIATTIVPLDAPKRSEDEGLPTTLELPPAASNRPGPEELVAMLTIETLPNEILALISSFLDPPEQITLGLTCKALLARSRAFKKGQMCLLKYSLRQRERLLNLLDRGSRHTIDCLMCSCIHSASDFFGETFCGIPKQCDPDAYWEEVDSEHPSTDFTIHGINTMHLQVLMKWHHGGLNISRPLRHIKKMPYFLTFMSTRREYRKYACTTLFDIKISDGELHVSNKFFALWNLGECAWSDNDCELTGCFLEGGRSTCPHLGFLQETSERRIEPLFREAFNTARCRGQKSNAGLLQCPHCETECTVTSHAVPEHGFFAVVVSKWSKLGLSVPALDSQPTRYTERPRRKSGVSTGVSEGPPGNLRKVFEGRSPLGLQLPLERKQLLAAISKDDYSKRAMNRLLSVKSRTRAWQAE